LSRTRCFPHTVNLIAKAFILFFFKQPKKKTQAKVTPGKRKCGCQSPPVTEPVTAAAAIEPQEERDEPVVADIEVDEEGVMDEGKAEFDAATIRLVRGQALAEAEADFLHMTVQEEREALMLFPKVSLFSSSCNVLVFNLLSHVAGLVHPVHDSATLQNKFEKLVAANASAGQKVALDRRVPTRWNSDLACLAAHVQFEIPVKELMSDGLTEYALSES
ncbi:hypothetical protein B0H10DRAFT_2251506, partial [Mycena sp. CBHHK59/15]